jgi:4-hydroxy-tetrahydrodipicolinate synthase
MPGADLIDAIVALWRALGTGDEAAVVRISQPLTALIAMQTSLDGFLAVEKHILVRRGIFPRATVRGPVGYCLDEESRGEVDRLFAQLQAALR